MFFLMCLFGTLSAAPQQVSERIMAPDFRLSDISGRLIQLSSLKGKVVLLDFWATTCGGCKIEIPWYMEFAERYKKDDLVVIGASLDDEGWKIVRPYLEQHPISYSVVIADEPMSTAYKVIELPKTLLIDREGRIAASHTGMVKKDEFEQEIRSLLK